MRTSLSVADRRRTKSVRNEQYIVLTLVESKLEAPMFVLSILWALLLVVELVWGLAPSLQIVVTVIWVAFLLEFFVRFVIAPSRIVFLRKNWLSVFALAIPALRVFRIARVFRIVTYGRALRGLTFARLLTAFNRGLKSLQRNMKRFGAAYLFGLTALMTVLGAAGILAFERQSVGGPQSFADALWFAAMMMTTIGSDFWPKTSEGRVLCFLLAVYAFAIFGYVTATIAAVLVGRAPDDAKAKTR